MYILQAPWQDLCPIFTSRVLIKLWSIQQGCKSSWCLGNQGPFSPSSISRSSILCQKLILTSHIEKNRCHFNTCDLINGHVCKCKTVITKLTHHPAWQTPAQWCAESFLQHNPHDQEIMFTSTHPVIPILMQRRTETTTCLSLQRCDYSVFPFLSWWNFNLLTCSSDTLPLGYRRLVKARFPDFLQTRFTFPWP